MHKVLLNTLGGLSLPRKEEELVRLTDRPGKHTVHRVINYKHIASEAMLTQAHISVILRERK